jgi:hypothetical protein
MHYGNVDIYLLVFRQRNEDKHPAPIIHHPTIN